MNKKKEKNDFKWFAEAKTVDLDSKEKREKPDRKLTGRDKYPPLPNGLSSNRPH